ncbi:MAG: FtsQ-type POTRA domain-containing protein [Ignavibacteriales bacterium]|nr:FtsQ-type POTRA domain-containing protein [Ignavibacteriales bacterium]
MSGIKHKIAGVSVLVTIVICLVFGANAWKSSLKIKQIKVDGNRIVGANEILQLTQVQMNTLLYNVDLTAVQRNVMSHHYIKDALVERNLPNSIHIQVLERVPIAIVNRAETMYLDENGVVLPRSISHRLFDLPMISGISASEPMVLGSIIKQPDVIEALQLLSTMKTVNRPMYHNISEVQLRNGGDIVVYSAEGGVPIIFGRDEMPSKLVRLETFWNTIVRTRGTQLLQYVDLRYQDQVVASWKSEPSATKSL